jgi:hypothetical protein
MYPVKITKFLVLWNPRVASFSLERRMDSFPGFETLWSGNITGHVTDLFAVRCTSSGYKLWFAVVKFARNNDSPRGFACFSLRPCLLPGQAKIRMQSAGVRSRMREDLLACESWVCIRTVYVRRKFWVWFNSLELVILWAVIYILSLSLWLYSPCGPWPLFQFLNPMHTW